MTRIRLAINPIQWMATDDGWLDPCLAPSLPTLLAKVKRAGFEAVMAAPQDGMDGEQYAGLLEDAGLQAAPGYFVLRPEFDASAVKQVLEEATLAAEGHAQLGLTEIGVGLSMSKGSPRVIRPAVGADPNPERLSAVVELIAAVSDRMLQLGVRPCLHPHVGTWVETEHETRAVLDAIADSRLGFLPDTGHLTWAETDVDALFDDYASRIPLVHVKDCRAQVAQAARANGWDYQETVTRGLWVEPGRGDLDLPALIGRLPDEFDGHLMVEVDRPDIPDPYRSAVAAAQWMHSTFRFAA